MWRFTVLWGVTALLNASFALAEPEGNARPITDAESVLAVYYEDWDLTSSGEPALILAVWPDGHAVWSDDRLEGGAPYRTGDVDPKLVKAVLERFEKDGLFLEKALDQVHVGPDSAFITVFVKSGKQKVKMLSWDELFEASGNSVGRDVGIAPLDGRRRLAILRGEPAEYLFYRFVWSETRATLANLIPRESRACIGELVQKPGTLSWREQPPDVKPTDPAGK